MDRGPCAPANVAGYGRVVRGARFKEREPWSFVRCGRIGALYQHSLRVRISCAPPLAHRKPEMRSLTGPFFFFSKGFSDAIRLSETGILAEIGLLTPRVSFHPPFTKIETDSKYHAISVCW